MPSTKSEPFFSLISVTFNDLVGMRRTEASIRAQTERDFEWVVVDGASKDGTVDFLRTLDLPYLQWTSERDKGIFDAMNKGTARARGKYVVYLNGGDAFSDAECLTDVRRALEQAGWPELCYGGGNWAFADGHRKYRAPRPMARAIRHGLPGLHQATFYRREFLDVPPYDLKYPVSADYYISARCYARGARACYVDRALADFGVGGNSMKKAAASLREAWDIQRDVLKLGWPARALSASRRYVAHRVLEGLHYFLHPQKKQATK